MNQIKFISVMLFGSAAIAFASPCTTDTLAFYQANYNGSGCTIGTNFVANNFSYLSVGVLTTPVTTSDILVTPTLGPAGPSLLFSATWDANLVGLSESAILFNLSAVIGSPFRFDGVTLRATGSTSGLAPVATVTEVDCLGGLLNVRSLAYTGLASVGCLGGGVEVGTAASLPAGLGVSAQAFVAFAPAVNNVDVLKNIAVAAVLGDAKVTSVSQGFTVNSPEPESALLALAGLAFLGLGKRLRRKSAEKIAS